MNEKHKYTGLTCPFPLDRYPKITSAHGGGGRLMRELVKYIFAEAFKESNPEIEHDSAILKIDKNRLAYTTDSFVVDPIFFPGGDIGKLAVYGTVNDLAMAGAKPLYLSVGMIIEEGFETELLWKIAVSMQRCASETNCMIVTGDTKTVQHGKGHGIYINTSGIGVIREDVNIHPSMIRPGDAVILNGDIGRHGIAVLAAREKLEFEPPVESDCASLAGAVEALLDDGVEIHCLRDLTRGGLGAGLNELAESSGLGISIDEAKIPVEPQIAGACEILGYDPIYIANEGRFVAVVPEDSLERALTIIGNQASFKNPVVIGRVEDGGEPLVTMNTAIGSQRVVDMPSGEQFPRIC